MNLPMNFQHFLNYRRTIQRTTLGKCHCGSAVKDQKTFGIIGVFTPSISAQTFLSDVRQVLEILQVSSFLFSEVGFEGDNRTYVISQLDILIPEEELEMER